MTRLLYHDEVENDLREAIRWYEGRREGLGDEFMQVVQETLDTIASSPYRYSSLRRDVRGARMKRFPYVILFYIFREQVVVILAILHKSRDPKVWEEPR